MMVLSQKSIQVRLAKFSLLVRVTKSKHFPKPVDLSRCCMAAWAASVSEQLTLALRDGSAQGQAPALALFEIMPMAANA